MTDDQPNDETMIDKQAIIQKAITSIQKSFIEGLVKDLEYTNDLINRMRGDILMENNAEYLRHLDILRNQQLGQVARINEVLNMLYSKYDDQRIAGMIKKYETDLYSRSNNPWNDVRRMD